MVLAALVGLFASNAKPWRGGSAPGHQKSKQMHRLEGYCFLYANYFAAPMHDEKPPPPLPKKRLSSASEAKSETAAALVGEEEEENGATEDEARGAQEGAEGYVESVGAGDPAGPPAHHLAVRAGLGDPVFFLLTFVAVTTSVAFISMVAVAIPTMLAMRRAANSFALLADAALDELPSTMTAVRLSGMEISDFTLELSDLRE
ncbi:uncharacterized protein LOC119360767 [Triticum dicoccoides]|uniref:uncharacterized protein LOC119360767 n=1 Tax=Triticum dicoccoides TaxID=85692 RepID=UPI00188F5B65|nr:uncharacterized protein LOC119360767 [Triticum dicoccoides]